MIVSMFLTVIPILSGSLDSTLKQADIMFNVIVPIALVIMVLGAIFGKKDK